MRKAVPRILLAGTNSGCGKTTVSCAVLQALVNRGLSVAAFKCGPDYIDPMFHSRIIGAESRNLDSFFFSENTLRYLLAENSKGKAISVLEGVMGYYDGMGADSTRASSYEIAGITRSPAVLIVDARGAALSVLATVDGFVRFRPRSRIRGVILNRCSGGLYPRLAKLFRERYGERLLPLGYLPEIRECTLHSRHLGLITAEETQGLREKMQRLAAETEKTVDLDGLIRLANTAGALEYREVPVKERETIRIGVAKDRAFCFYYEDSLQLLRRMGAELIPFSPLTDPALPEKLHGLYLGGGYPELYARQLSENREMRREIKAALERNLPCLAECGGFLYLTERLDGLPMVGFLPGSSGNTGRLQRFGYIRLQARRDNLLCRAGESIPAHSFHYYDTEKPGDGFRAEKSSGRSWDCVVSGETLYAGFPHIHFYAQPEFAGNFYEHCLKEKHRYDRNHEAHGDRNPQL